VIWWRRAGAFLFWATIQTLFLAPRTGGFRGGRFEPLFQPPVGVLVNLAVAAGFLWWYVLRPAARRNRRRLATFRARPAGEAWHWLPFVVAAIMGLLASGLIVTARVLTPRENRMEFLERYARLPGGALAVLVMIAVVVPLLEEFLFRGWMQRSLERLLARRTPDRRTAGWLAIAVTSAVFAAVHFESFGFPLRVIFAVSSGYAAWTTRSIWPSVVMHGSYNAWALLLGGILPIQSTKDLAVLAARPAVLAPAALGFAASALLLAWALRAMAASRARPVERAGARALAIS
jgi:membrane protease YdiL (CAAX protease family)